MIRHGKESAIPYAKHLKVFHSVCQHGSMLKASTALHRAQSAVQRSIQQLEACFETPLFERTARGVLLTDSGKTLERRVGYALAEMQSIRDELYQESGARPRNAPIFSLALNERRLEILAAFSEQRHMSLVAQQLDISQPAVSMALRDLEDSTGLELFDRSTAIVGLTAAGERLLAHLKRALHQLRLASAEISAQEGVLTGQVIIGALPFGRPYILPTAIAQVHARHPALRFTSVEGPFETLAHGLWCGDIDFVLGALPSIARHTDLVREDIFKERLAIIARQGHPLQRQPLDFERLMQEAEWVLPACGTPTRTDLHAALDSVGAPHPHATVESSDLSLIRGLLLGSNLITAASPHLFQQELDNGALVALPVELPDTQRTIGILRRTQEHSSPAAQCLIEQIRAIHSTALDTPARPRQPGVKTP